MARDDLAAAEVHLTAALNRFAGYPVPLVEWRIYSLLARLHFQLADGKACQAFEEARRIVHAIAGNIEEEKLRASFLSSSSVQKCCGGRGSSKG